MRIRWFRVAAAAVAVVGGVPALLTTGMWATSPWTSPVERSMPGPDDCSTDEVLEAGLPLVETLEDGRLAADVLLGAARCARVEELDWERLFEVFELAEDGLAWVAANEDGEVALDQALDVWELAADQRWAGSLVNVAVWTAVSSQARDIVEDHLFRVSVPARDEARERLVRIAAAPADWEEVRARDERVMWQVTAKIVTVPAAWVEMPLMPWTLWQARQGSHRLTVDIASDERTTRVEAAVLAGAAELAPELGGSDGCPDFLAVSGELPGIELTVDPELCVVAGVNGTEIRMASPWTGLLDALR